MNATESIACAAIGKIETEKSPILLNDTTPKSGIYGLRCKTTNKWYVGQSNNMTKRWNRYYKNFQCAGQRKLYHAFLKYGYDDFDKVCLEQCEPILEILNKKETEWIIKKDSVESGYNLTYGGDRREMLAETKKRIGDSKRGKKLGPLTYAQRKQRSISSLGRKHTEEMKRYLSLINTGKKHTEESKIKMSNYIKTEEHRKNLSKSHLGVLFSQSRKDAIKEGLDRRRKMGLSIGRPKKI